MFIRLDLYYLLEWTLIKFNFNEEQLNLKESNHYRELLYLGHCCNDLGHFCYRLGQSKFLRFRSHCLSFYDNNLKAFVINYKKIFFDGQSRSSFLSLSFGIQNTLQTRTSRSFELKITQKNLRRKFTIFF